LFSATYSEFKTESEQYSTLRWKTPNVQHEEHKTMLACGCRAENLNVQFEEIEHKMFGKDGFEDARKGSAT
jgi:hypothetical protein